MQYCKGICELIVDSLAILAKAVKRNINPFEPSDFLLISLFDPDYLDVY